MAMVTLDRAWLALASSPATSLTGFTSGRSEVIAAPGEVRRMANGRLRTVSRVGTATTIGVTFRNLTPAQVQTLRSWLGLPVLFRDVWGRKVYAVYFSADVTDYRDRSGQDVALTLSEVTISEAV